MEIFGYLYRLWFLYEFIGDIFTLFVNSKGPEIFQCLEAYFRLSSSSTNVSGGPHWGGEGLHSSPLFHPLQISSDGNSVLEKLPAGIHFMVLSKDESLLVTGLTLDYIPIECTHVP